MFGGQATPRKGSPNRVAGRQRKHTATRANRAHPNTHDDQGRHFAGPLLDPSCILAQFCTLLILASTQEKLSQRTVCVSRRQTLRSRRHHQMSGVQNCVVFSCREIKPYGRPYARLTFLYVLLTATHVCMASLTLCLRKRYASPLWSHVVCCCKIPSSFHMICFNANCMVSCLYSSISMVSALSERKLLQIYLGPAVMKVQ